MNGGNFLAGARKNDMPESVRSIEADVVGCMGFKITDGILKNLPVTGLEKPLLFKKSFSDSQNVLVRCPVRGVVTRNAMCLAFDLRKQHDAKCSDFALVGAPRCREYRPFEPLRKFLFRHRGQDVTRPCGWESRSWPHLGIAPNTARAYAPSIFANIKTSGPFIEANGRTIFDSKTQGYPFHEAMLAVAMLLEHRFPNLCYNRRRLARNRRGN